AVAVDIVEIELVATDVPAVLCSRRRLATRRTAWTRRRRTAAARLARRVRATRSVRRRSPEAPGLKSAVHVAFELHLRLQLEITGLAAFPDHVRGADRLLTCGFGPDDLVLGIEIPHGWIAVPVGDSRAVENGSPAVVIVEVDWFRAAPGGRRTSGGRGRSRRGGGGRLDRHDGSRWRQGGLQPFQVDVAKADRPRALDLKSDHSAPPEPRRIIVDEDRHHVAVQDVHQRVAARDEVDLVPVVDVDVAAE